MYHIPALYTFARQQNIAVLDYPLPQNSSMSLMTDTGECYIGMDPSVKDGGKEEARLPRAHPRVAERGWLL